MGWGAVLPRSLHCVPQKARHSGRDDSVACRWGVRVWGERRLLVRGNGRLVPLTVGEGGTSVKEDVEWCAWQRICVDERFR